MSWSVCDPIRRAETAARGLTHTERLAVAWRLVEGVDDPEDFHQLDMFLGMTAEHCRDVRLEAAIAADRETFAEGNFSRGSARWEAACLFAGRVAGSGRRHSRRNARS
ncbi:hypothetical protein [Marinovum sp. B10]|uniref:hypothetical protein n=1 Tax=Marinovum sp. B10 TaxID=3449224 RepID=UPI003EDC1192